MRKSGSSLNARGFALAIVVGIIAGCGGEQVKVAGGTEGPPPATQRAKKAAEAESKIVKHLKLR